MALMVDTLHIAFRDLEQEIYHILSVMQGDSINYNMVLTRFARTLPSAIRCILCCIEPAMAK